MNKTWAFRPMEPDDVGAVTRIEQQNFSEPWNEQGFLDAIQMTNTLFLVAEQEGEILGYAGCYQSFDEGEIVNVSVHLNYQGRGVGKALLTELLKRGKNQGVEAFTLEVRVSNQRAITLYQSLGFESAGVRKKFYRKPVEDAYIFWKR